ncbi:MAG: putative Ig domain-containing protein [Myxococcaceae bacterium]|nr:putative Ig domain-containing protein [Myxococcaceae bacterium]
MKSRARQVSSGKRIAAFVLWPMLAIQGCTNKEEAGNTPATAMKQTSALESASGLTLLQPYEKQQVPMEWRAITGTSLALTDESVTNITSPFPIKFANGAGSTSLRVGMNGGIQVGTTGTLAYGNTALPNASKTTLIVPFWDDLFPGNPSATNNVFWAVTGNAPSRELVVEWRNVLHYDLRQESPLNPVTFQVVFFEDSPDILFNYLDVTLGDSAYDKGASASVGVQNSSTEAIQHSYNTASLEDNTAYLYTFIVPSEPPVLGAVTASPANLTEGETLSVDTSFTDADGDTGGPWKIQVDTGYAGAAFTTDFFAIATAQGPVSVTGVVRTSGDITVGVRALDNGGVASAVGTTTVSVADVPPELSPVAIAGAATERVPVTLTSAFTDPGLDAPWKVQWDFDYDGIDFTVDLESDAMNPGDIALNHMFDHDGNLTVALRITDKDGVMSDIRTLQVAVADLTPSLTGIAGGQELYEGGTLDLSAVFTDPGDNSKPWRIQWDLDYDGVTFDVDEEEQTDIAGEIHLTRYARDSGQVQYALRVVDDDGSITEVRTLDMNIIEAEPILSPLAFRYLSGASDEPSAVAFDLSASSGAEDPNADPIRGFLWDFDGDGNFDYASTTPYALFNYRDNPAGGSEYTALVRVMDEDTFAEEQIIVAINNVAPTLSAPGAADATAGSLMALRVAATDPGNDAITFTASNAPAGLTMTADGLVLWNPTRRQATRAGRPYTFTVTATDDDGASDSADITVTARWLDADDDGMDDNWERENGLDPTSAADASGDTDGDGVSNLAEFLNENGGPRTPEAAVANGPLSGDKVDAAQLTLTTLNVSDAGDLTSVRYQFQLFADAALTTKVRDETVVQDGAGATTSITFTDGTESVDLVDLEDDHVYGWRVRATDGDMVGPWSSVQRITFNPANDAPDAPRAAQPLTGSQVSTDKPVLTVDNAVDVDDASLTYTFELAENAALTTGLVTSAEIAAGAKGSTSWTVGSSLQPFTTYYWRVTATDPHGATSQSEVSSFTVFIGRPSNREPGIPGLAEPSINGTVASLTPELVADAATDSDGDALTYVIELDTAASFTSPSLQASSALQAGDDGKVRWQPAALTENQRYYWRARALDPYSASDWQVGSFVVNAQNDAPSAPVALNPSDAVIYTLKPTLIVQNSADPEGDAITYSFDVRTAEGAVAVTGDAAAGANGHTSFKLGNDLEAGVEYIWVARAKDGAGAVSAASTEARFQVYKAPEIPEPPKDDGGCSAGAGSLGGLLPLLAMALGLFRRRRS